MCPRVVVCVSVCVRVQRTLADIITCLCCLWVDVCPHHASSKQTSHFVTSDTIFVDIRFPPVIETNVSGHAEEFRVAHGRRERHHRVHTQHSTHTHRRLVCTVEKQRVEERQKLKKTRLKKKRKASGRKKKIHECRQDWLQFPPLLPLQPNNAHKTTLHTLLFTSNPASTPTLPPNRTQ